MIMQSSFKVTVLFCDIINTTEKQWDDTGILLLNSEALYWVVTCQWTVFECVDLEPLASAAFFS